MIEALSGTSIALALANSGTQVLGLLGNGFTENEWRKKELAFERDKFNENTRQFNVTDAREKDFFTRTEKFNYDRFREDIRQFDRNWQLGNRAQTLQENTFQASESQRRIENASFFNMAGRA